MCAYFVHYVAASHHNLAYAAAKGWELFYLVASAMPPSKDYVGLVSEYVHTVSHNDSEEPSVRAMAQRTWNSLKRSAKAGPRKTVNFSAQQACQRPLFLALCSAIQMLK